MSGTLLPLIPAPITSNPHPGCFASSVSLINVTYPPGSTPPFVMERPGKKSALRLSERGPGCNQQGIFPRTGSIEDSVSFSIPDHFESLRPKTLSQLRQIQTLWNNMLPMGILDSFGKIRTRSKRPRRELAFAHAADHPIVYTRRFLDDEVFRLAVPCHSPSHRPAMARPHHAAIPKINAAVRRLNIVIEHSRCPALMRFCPPIAAKYAVKNNDRARLTAARTDEPHTVRIDLASVNQNLTAVWGELCRPGRAQMRGFAIHNHPLHGNASATRPHTVHCFINHEIPQPAVFSVNPYCREVRLGMTDLLGR